MKEYSTVLSIIGVLRKIGFRASYLLIPTGLALISALFEGVSMGLLIPILNGFFQKSFSFIRDIPILGGAFDMLPSSVVENDRMLFAALLGGFVVIYVIKNLVRYAAAVSVSYFSQRALHHLRKVLFGRYLSFGKLFFDRTNVGHHSTLLLEFTREALHPIADMGRLINAVFSLAVYFAIMMMISWQLTLVALPLFVILHFAVRFMMVRIKLLSKSITARGSELGKKSVEILSTIPLVKSYSAERMEQDKYTVISHEKAKYDYQVRALGAMVLPMQESITILFAVTVFVGSLILFGRDQIGSASALIVYFYIVMNASNKFGAVIGFRSILAGSNGPLQEVLAMFTEDDKYYVRGGNTEFAGLKNAIAFKGLNFSYVDDREVLRDVRFTIPAGRMTAIVGATGSGKSTLISLLMRYYDCPPDAIEIDGIDIRTFSLISYLKHVALVSQETLLIHDSLRNNIAYGLDDVSDHAVREAVRRARLSDFVASLPEGLETLIGDRGVKLSGGEKQRVSIARALLKQADILILDEATSSLDSKTENLIQEAIDEAVTGHTSIVIAHRLSTIQHADQIVVIDNGRVAETGTLKELLDRKGKFHELWEEQKFS